MNNKLEKLLELHEGYRQFVYDCGTGLSAKASVGKLTAGIGRNLEQRGLTEDEALFLLKNDLSYFEYQLKQRLPWFDALDEVRQAVLIDMAFNLGENGLLAFQKMLAALHRKDYAEAAKEMQNSRWFRQVGNRALRLQYMMLTGEWPKEVA